MTTVNPEPTSAPKRPYRLFGTVLHGRVLTCTHCQTSIEVIEASQGAKTADEHDWINPADYTCGNCLQLTGRLHNEIPINVVPVLSLDQPNDLELITAAAMDTVAPPPHDRQHTQQTQVSPIDVQEPEQRHQPATLPTKGAA